MDIFVLFPFYAEPAVENRKSAVKGLIKIGRPFLDANNLSVFHDLVFSDKHRRPNGRFGVVALLERKVYARHMIVQYTMQENRRLGFPRIAMVNYIVFYAALFFMPIELYASRIYLYTLRSAADKKMTVKNKFGNCREFRGYFTRSDGTANFVQTEIFQFFLQSARFHNPFI